MVVSKCGSPTWLLSVFFCAFFALFLPISFQLFVYIFVDKNVVHMGQNAAQKNTEDCTLLFCHKKKKDSIKMTIKTLTINTFDDKSLILRFTDARTTFRHALSAITDRDSIGYVCQGIDRIAFSKGGRQMAEEDLDQLIGDEVDPLKMVEYIAPRPPIVPTNELINVVLIPLTLTKSSFNIPISPNALVYDLKCSVAYNQGVVADQFRLIFKGKHLDDSRTLKHYDVVEGSQIHLILRLRGGMYHSISGRGGKYTPLAAVTIYDLDTNTLISSGAL